MESNGVKMRLVPKRILALIEIYEIPWLAMDREQTRGGLPLEFCGIEMNRETSSATNYVQQRGESRVSGRRFALEKVPQSFPRQSFRQRR